MTNEVKVNNNAATITVEEIVDAGYKAWDPNGTFAVEYYDADGKNQVMVYTSGVEAAAAITKTFEHRSWLGLTDGWWYHYRPATDTEVEESGKLIVSEPDAVRPWVEEYPEEEVYIHVLYKRDEAPQAFIYGQRYVKNPRQWAKGFTLQHTDGAVSVFFTALVCDFEDCRDETVVKAKAVELAAKVKTADDNAIAVEIIKSIEAVVTPELSLLRLAYAADVTTSTLLFKTINAWKNHGIIRTVKAAEDTVRWYNAVDTDKPVAKYEVETLYQPLKSYEFESTIDNIVYDLLTYALRSLKRQIGLELRKINRRCYDFSFYTKSGAFVDTLSSDVDPEIIRFEVNGKTVLESNAICRRWRGIVKGNVEF